MPACLRQIPELKPTRDYGLGRYAALALYDVAQRLPEAARRRLSPVVGAPLQPRAAYVYAIPADCRFSLDRKPAA